MDQHASSPVRRGRSRRHRCAPRSGSERGGPSGRSRLTVRAAPATEPPGGSSGGGAATVTGSSGGQVPTTGQQPGTSAAGASSNGPQTAPTPSSVPPTGPGATGLDRAGQTPAGQSVPSSVPEVGPPGASRRRRAVVLRRAGSTGRRKCLPSPQLRHRCRDRPEACHLDAVAEGIPNRLVAGRSLEFSGLRPSSGRKPCEPTARLCAGNNCEVPRRRRRGESGKPVRVRHGPATVTGERPPMSHWASAWEGG